MHEAEIVEHHRPKRNKRSWRPRKIFVALLAAVLIFGCGYLAGHGSLRLRSAIGSNKNLPNQLNYSSVNQVYDLLKQNFDGNLTQNQLLDGVKTGLVNASGDPYTEFFNPATAKEFNDQLSGSFTGIGAELGKDSDGNIVVIAPLSGYPAEKAGLKSKDIVAAVDGQSISGLGLEAVVQKIRGPADTKVIITVVRGNATPINLTITRAQITVPSVEHHVDGAIGYLKISQFGKDTVGLAKAASQDFKAKGVKAVVLDLRGDPGGYLNAAVDISSLWLDQGKTVVQERRGATIISTEYANGDDPLHGLPTVVLIDGGSASASEITAGALHDNGMATLVGAKSFGKGSVQQVINLSDGSELKVTTAHWYTPAGKNIDKQGINPDIVVSIIDNEVKAGQDPQKAKAYEILQSKL